MAELDKECFADQSRKKYPIFSKQAALESFKEFKDDIDKYEQQDITRITNNFIKAANAFDICYNVAEQEGSPQVDTYDTSAGTLTISKIASKQNLEDFIKSLDTIRQQLPLSDLRKIASDVLFKIEDTIDSPMQRKLQIYAGFGVCDPEGIISQFKKRAFLINVPRSVQKQFYDVYNSLEASKNIDEEVMYKCATVLCDTLDDMDRMYKLSQYYGSKLKRPQEVCFGETLDDLTEEASDYLHVASTDTILSKKALLESKPAVIEFLKDKYQYQTEDDDKMFSKIASLSDTGVKGLIQAVNEYIQK